MFGIFHRIFISHPWPSRQGRAWGRCQVESRGLPVLLWRMLLSFISEDRPRFGMRVLNILLFIWKVLFLSGGWFGRPQPQGGGMGEDRGRVCQGRMKLMSGPQMALRWEAGEGTEEAEFTSRLCGLELSPGQGVAQGG